MALKTKIVMTLGRDVTEEPPPGSTLIAEKAGYLWAFHRTDSKNVTPQWTAATIKEEQRQWAWEEVKALNILVVFETPEKKRKIR